MANTNSKWLTAILASGVFLTTMADGADSPSSSTVATTVKVRRYFSNSETNWAVTLDKEFSVIVSRGKLRTNFTGETVLSSFKPQSLEAVKSMFKKFIEWEKTAQDNNAEEFTREIATVDGKKFNFEWKAWRSRNREAQLVDVAAISQAGLRPMAGFGLQLGCNYVSEDAKQFLLLLEKLPEMQKEYDQRIANAKRQSELFK